MPCEVFSREQTLTPQWTLVTSEGSAEDWLVHKGIAGALAPQDKAGRQLQMWSTLLRKSLQLLSGRRENWRSHPFGVGCPGDRTRIPTPFKHLAPTLPELYPVQLRQLISSLFS